MEQEQKPFPIAYREIFYKLQTQDYKVNWKSAQYDKCTIKMKAFL